MRYGWDAFNVVLLLCWFPVKHCGWVCGCGMLMLTDNVLIYCYTLVIMIFLDLLVFGRLLLCSWCDLGFWI